jgi:hypothetical protein
MRGRDRRDDRTWTTRAQVRGDGATRRDRAVSSAVTHALAVGISAVLVVLLVNAMGGFLQDESERVTRQEMESLGARIADDVSAADHLAREGAAVNVSASVPDRLVDTRLRVSLDRGDCPGGPDATCLVLRAPDRDLTVRQPLANRTAMSLDRANGTVFLRASGTGGTTAGGRGPPPVAPTVGVGRPSGIGGGSVVVGNRDPVAGFLFAPGNPVAGDNITFTNDTEDLDGQITAYEWRFERPDGNNRTVSGPQAVHKYETPGVYTATLEVTDDRGETDSVSRTVPVSGLVVTGEDEMDIDSDGQESGLTVTFNNSWSDTVTITTVAVDPTDDDIDALDERTSGHEVEVDVGGDGSLEGFVEYGGGRDLPDQGRIFDLDRDGTTCDGDYSSVCDEDPTVAPDESVTVSFTEFRDDGAEVDDLDDHPVDVAVRYRVDGRFYVTSARVFGDGPAGTVRWDSAADWDAATGSRNVTHPDGTVRLDAAAGSGGLPTSDLRVWLPLNETGSPDEAIDYAPGGGGNGYQFEVVEEDGEPTLGVPGVEGVGTAYEFDGDSWLRDYNADTTYLDGEDALTISMWVQADRTGTNEGLIDSVYDGDEGNDDELGLRYDSNGYAGGGEESFKSSIQLGNGAGGGTHSYEYESDVQSTDWQHVAMRWEAGEPVELFVDGRKLSIRAGDGNTPGSADLDADEIDFLGLARSQKDGTDALWEGRMDEVRIYDRALTNTEVQSLAARGGLRTGSLTTDWKSTDAALDLEELQLGYDATRRSGAIEVVVEARRGGSVVRSDPVLLSGDTGVREVRGLVGDADEFRLDIEFRGLSEDPEADAFTLSD